jgi:hypothetical protein
VDRRIDIENRALWAYEAAQVVILIFTLRDSDPDYFSLLVEVARSSFGCIGYFIELFCRAYFSLGAPYGQPCKGGFGVILPLEHTASHRNYGKTYRLYIFRKILTYDEHTRSVKVLTCSHI